MQVRSRVRFIKGLGFPDGQHFSKIIETVDALVGHGNSNQEPQQLSAQPLPPHLFVMVVCI